MAQDNRISLAIQASVISDALVNIKKVSDALKPFLQALTVEERQTLPKMKDKTIAFVEKINTYAVSNPEFSPTFLDVTEFKKDLEAVQSLKPVLDAITILSSDIDDTIMLCGSEAYTGARYYYNTVSFAAKNGNTSAKPIADDLARRFPGARRKKNTD